MKIIDFLIRVFFDAYRDTKIVILHYGAISINGLIIVSKLYIIRLLYSFSFIWNLIRIKILNNISQNPPKILECLLVKQHNFR